MYDVGGYPATGLLCQAVPDEGKGSHSGSMQPAGALRTPCLCFVNGPGCFWGLLSTLESLNTRIPTPCPGRLESCWFYFGSLCAREIFLVKFLFSPSSGTHSGFPWWSCFYPVFWKAASFPRQLLTTCQITPRATALCSL